MPTETTLRIIQVIGSLRHGRVSSYGAIAAAAGLPNGARQVVRILNSSSEKRELAWWRVLRADGSIALGKGSGFELQKALLESEGVEVSPAGRVDLARFGQSGLGAMDLTPSGR